MKLTLSKSVNQKYWGAWELVVNSMPILWENLVNMELELEREYRWEVYSNWDLDCQY